MPQRDAAGQPVSGVEVAIYQASFPGLDPAPKILARGVTDGRGIALLPGTEQLDPQLQVLQYDYDLRTPKLFVRCRKGADLALLPLTGAFNARISSDYREGYAGDYLRRRFGHIHTWGTTAQGVYRAGDTIQYKLYVRNQDNRTFVPPPPDANE